MLSTAEQGDLATQRIAELRAELEKLGVPLQPHRNPVAPEIALFLLPTSKEQGGWRIAATVPIKRNVYTGVWTAARNRSDGLSIIPAQCKFKAAFWAASIKQMVDDRAEGAEKVARRNAALSAGRTQLIAEIESNKYDWTYHLDNHGVAVSVEKRIFLVRFDPDRGGEPSVDVLGLTFSGWQQVMLAMRTYELGVQQVKTTLTTLHKGMNP